MRPKAEQIKNIKSKPIHAIAIHNDQLRKHHIGGRIMMSKDISNLHSARIHMIMKQIADFSNFNSSNDPYEERDCAILEIDNLSIMWKIDYYDETLDGHSPDPSNPDVTVRIMTVMLAEEY